MGAPIRKTATAQAAMAQAVMTHMVIGLAVMGLACAAQAAPGTKVAQPSPSPDACLKNVNAIGASMGHTAETAADGRTTYRFVLRTNGLDYEVVCDAATGMLGDVAPRTSH